jgi:hypothetical protein
MYLGGVCEFPKQPNWECAALLVKSSLARCQRDFSEPVRIDRRRSDPLVTLRREHIETSANQCRSRISPPVKPVGVLRFAEPGQESSVPREVEAIERGPDRTQEVL